MLISTKAIVLSKIKYRDSDLIIRCYTEKRGVVSVLLRNVLQSKRGHAKAAYFQLLSQLEVVMIYKENRALQTIKEMKTGYLYETIHTNIFKSAIAMFIAEVLSGVLQEEEENKILFSYLETTLQWLDSHSEYTNFHVLFLLKLTKYLGFYPDISTMGHPFFNLQEGKFVAREVHNHTISGENIVLLKQLLGTTFDDLNTVKIKSKQRQSFLDLMLRYFGMHLGHFKYPRSLPIFNQVFN
ncbi:DNA repair protein RecO [Aestuariivivens sediminis]|uniref:DNA repair protein RecO n=1 Tax=Aestuariivivens sediminis TaxID=2913557 RepID=UPI001F59B68F|nr:DNA repair protein RecO [Aestuariivivens sediminis]